MRINQNGLIETTGIIEEIIDAVSFKVRTEEDQVIVATISNKVNLEFDIYIGEEVPLHMSPYDLKRGVIHHRYWKRKRKRPRWQK